MASKEHIIIKLWRFISFDFCCLLVCTLLYFKRKFYFCR